jgi:hypothetical protein
MSGSRTAILGTFNPSSAHPDVDVILGAVHERAALAGVSTPRPETLGAAAALLSIGLASPSSTTPAVNPAKEFFHEY